MKSYQSGNTEYFYTQDGSKLFEPNGTTQEHLSRIGWKPDLKKRSAPLWTDPKTGKQWPEATARLLQKSRSEA